MDDAGVLTRGELLTRLGEVMQDEERSEASLRSIIEHQHRMILNPGERMDYGDAMLRH
jgi:hypothetical protein